MNKSELPSSLPGYLIHLKAQIRIGGHLASQSTPSVTMGDTLTQRTAYYDPGTQQWEEGEPNSPIASEYHAIGLELQGVSASQLTALKTKLEQTKPSWNNSSKTRMISPRCKADYLMGGMALGNDK